ncbi:MAG: hypothetical protein DMG88_23400 [Acidobacteria bacterium]|nr:MAG: hypothetical protein DMG88_23400 [Acidobacteriota bacterium]
MWSLEVPKNSVSSRPHDRKPYIAPQFKRLTLAEAKAKLLASTAHPDPNVKKLLDWIAQLENRQRENK